MTAAPVPGTDELLDRARALVPLLRANAAKTEQARNVVPEVLDALREAGMFRLTTPAEFGGYDVGLRTQLELVFELSRGCASTGWTVANDAGSTDLAKLMPPHVLKEMFDANADAMVITTVATPESRATVVDGGVEFSGRFPWSTNSQIADWAMLLAVPIEAPDGTITRAVTVLIPLAGATIEDTWHVAGMSGTGTQTVVADRLFVPDSRMIEHDHSLTERYDQKFTEQLSEYYRPSGLIGGNLISMASIVGTAQGALDLTRTSLEKKRPVSYTTYQNKTDSPALRLWLAEATHLIDTAFLHMRLVADALDAERQSPVGLEWVERARIRMHMATALQRAREGVEKLLDIGGVGSFALANPLQRHWRDLGMGSRHAMVNLPLMLEDYSLALLDLKPSIAMLH